MGALVPEGHAVRERDLARDVALVDVAWSDGPSVERGTFHLARQGGRVRVCGLGAPPVPARLGRVRHHTRTLAYLAIAGVCPGDSGGIAVDEDGRAVGLLVFSDGGGSGGCSERTAVAVALSGLSRMRWRPVEARGRTRGGAERVWREEGR